MATELRIKRTESIIRDMVSRMIVRGEIKDYRVSSFISISEVVLSKDLDHAKIYVTSYDSQEGVEKAVKGLNSAAGFIQSKIGKKLRQRVTPKLHFIQDDAMDRSMAIQSLLDEISHDEDSSENALEGELSQRESPQQDGSKEDL